MNQEISEKRLSKNAWIKILGSKRMLMMLCMGFASGLPLLLIGGTLQAWMHDVNVDLKTIGLFALVGLPYTLKFIWAPLMDRYLLHLGPIHGRRRGWLIYVQLGLALSIGTLALLNPSQTPFLVAVVALLISLFSASQDIVLDAYRREILPDIELGLGSSIFISGYRLGMLVGGALALFLADLMTWHSVYLLMMLFMCVGIGTTLFATEPKIGAPPPKSLHEAVLQPLVEYFHRPDALKILIFILLYKIGDSMASHMTTPFILELGFTKTQMALVAKTFGLAATLLGGIVGGVLMIRLGMARSLWIFGVLQMISTLGFSIQAMVGQNLEVLTGVIAFENFASGMGTSAFVAYMASLVNKRFSATQYALLSSLMGVPRVLAAAPTGWMVKQLSWGPFFLVCTLAAIPAFFLLWQLEPLRERRHKN